MENVAKTDLTLVPVDDLLDEVEARFDAMLFIGELQFCGGGGYQVQGKGSPAVRLGLASTLMIRQQCALQQILEDQGPGPEVD